MISRLGLALLIGLTACASDPGTGTVTVSAASSLGPAVADIEEAFERRWPDYDLVVNLGGSSGLREQVLAGAPVDVFIPADTSIMDEVVSAGLVGGSPVVIATNRLALVTPAGNPGGVAGLADLSREDLLVGLCASEVPCGRLADEMLAAAGVQARVDTREPNVGSLLGKVESGDLDVGVVYVTDALRSDLVAEIDIGQAAGNVSTAYPAAVLSAAPNPDGARAFLALLSSAEGTAILDSHGFGRP